MGKTRTSAEAPVKIMSGDEECLKRLALLIEHKDTKKLSEIIDLVARLTAPIQLASN